MEHQHAQQNRPRRRKNAIREVHALSKGAGSSKLTKKIRDVERTLRKPGLAATKKLEAERALVALKAELEDVRKEQAKKELASKYHMVRFFGKYLRIKQNALFLEKPMLVGLTWGPFLYIEV